VTKRTPSPETCFASLQNTAPCRPQPKCAGAVHVC
jgi:hypothetical protein